MLLLGTGDPAPRLREELPEKHLHTADRAPGGDGSAGRVRGLRGNSLKLRRKECSLISINPQGAQPVVVRGQNQLGCLDVEHVEQNTNELKNQEEALSPPPYPRTLSSPSPGPQVIQKNGQQARQRRGS